jgi:hypothetical protein
MKFFKIIADIILKNEIIIERTIDKINLILFFLKSIPMHLYIKPPKIV